MSVDNTNHRVTDIFIRAETKTQVPIFTVRLDDNREGSGYTLSQAIVNSLNYIDVDDTE